MVQLLFSNKLHSIIRNIIVQDVSTAAPTMNSILEMCYLNTVMASKLA